MDPLGDYLQADGTVTVFLIVQSQTSSVPAIKFASSEHGGISGPQLDVTIIPEPASLALLILAAAVFIAARRFGRAR